MELDYYPFGMQMPGRKYSVGIEYRFGFNGKENDKDVSEGTQDYGMRIYDARLGRFLSVDPLTLTYPMLTPYQFASNTPIQAIDLDGLEGVKVIDKKNKTITFVVEFVYVLRSVSKNKADPTENSIARVKKSINDEIAKADPGALVDDATGYEIKFDIKYTPMKNQAEVDARVQNNDNIYDPVMALKIAKDESDTKTIVVDGEEMEQTTKKLAQSHWRSLEVTDTKLSHSIFHELFHNLTHNHKNAPKDLKTQIDPKNQAPGHNEAGGIFAYANEITGETTKNLSKKNIQDALRTVPETVSPRQTPDVVIPPIK